MAPNVHRIRPLVAIPRPIAALKEYRPAPPTTVNSDPYWLWNSEPDMFSIEHITANLLLASQVQTPNGIDRQPSSRDHAKEQHDMYWMERAQPKYHGCAESMPHYWDGPSYRLNRTEQYWYMGCESF